MSRIPNCCHPQCTNIGVHKIGVYRRGGRPAYLCDMHLRRDGSYHYENILVVGTDKKHGNTVSVEYETMETTEKARVEFIQNSYEPTHDGTVVHEYKSPIMNGLNGLSKHCETYQRLIDSGDIRLDDSCGTHFNNGNIHMPEEALAPNGYIGRYLHSLYIPLSDYLLDHPEDCKKVFGRELCYWAQPITASSEPDEHRNFINLQHDTHIEYRVCKFVTAKQYMTAAKLCVKFTECVMTNFVEHFNDDYDKIDARRYYKERHYRATGEKLPSKDAYRKHKAQVAANKLVELFKKAAASL